MAVIVILGILTTIVAVNVAPFLQRAEYEKARTDIAQIEKALETYRFQHYSYPTTDQGIRYTKTGCNLSWQDEFFNRVF